LLAKQIQELRELRQEMRDPPLQMAVKWVIKSSDVPEKNI
jgi:aryl-alcohol dehydrogenase-like predicted oxidoreductase